MKILVINAGSSSLKLQLLDSTKQFTCLHRDIIERIGFKGSIKNHTQALKIAVQGLIQKRILTSLQEIDAVGHRVVHGGEKYKSPVNITPGVIRQIKKLCKLAPLHNPPNLESIIACRKLLKKTPQVAVFDTAFHHTLPEKAYLYALPYEYYKRYGVRRYGFHGTSHAYVTRETNKLLGKKKSKIITCHLGNGSSVTAVLNGKSIDTSMGFTPLEGLPMGTRSGDLDPAIVFKLMELLHLSTSQIDEILNKSSGLKGISGLSADIRDLRKNYKSNRRAKLALDILAYRTAKYIGAYTAALNGLDALTFTAGIGQNAYYLRQQICNHLQYLKLKLNPQKNKNNAREISAKTSKVKVYVIPTNEEKAIAMTTAAILKI